MLENLQKQIDEKHSVFVEGEVTDNSGDFITLSIHKFGILKHTNGQEIDLDVEPVIPFRGRDKLALPMLLHYRQLCVEDGCTDFQLQSMDSMIAKFQKFADESPTMKQPGSTLGK